MVFEKNSLSPTLKSSIRFTFIFGSHPILPLRGLFPGPPLAPGPSPNQERTFSAKSE
jgi:hypothetical protein